MEGKTRPQYREFLKEWSDKNKITSFFGSDKSEFLQDWNNVKNAESRKSKTFDESTIKDAIDEYIKERDRFFKLDEVRKKTKTGKLTKVEKKDREERLTRLRLQLDDTIKEPFYRDAEQRFSEKYGGLPLTNGDKSGFSEKKIDSMLSDDVSKLMEEYNVPPLPK
jgi:hypothetical protein